MRKTNLKRLILGLAVTGAVGLGAQQLYSHNLRSEGVRNMQGLTQAAKAPETPETSPSRFRSENSLGFNTATTFTVATAQDKAPKAKAANADFKIYGALGKTSNRAQGAVYCITPDGVEMKSTIRSVDGGAFYDGSDYNVISELGANLNIYALYPYETQWWTSTPKNGESVNSSCTASDLSYDVTSGRVFGCFSNGAVNAKWEFASVDYSSKSQTTINKSRKKICSIDRWDGVAVNAEGVVYVIDEYGTLMTVDKASGRPSVIGSTGLRPYYQGSATFDNNGKLYYSYAPETGNGALYEIDITTAEATLLLEYPEGLQLVGIYAPVEALIAKAPGRPTDLFADFPDGATSGKVSFRLPKTLNDGTPGEGTVNWSFKVNNWENNSGTGNYGDLVECPYSSWGGNTTFSVSCSNSAGQGPSAETTLYIGTPPLESPANIILKRIGDKVTLTWNPVTKNTLGKDIDPATVRYAITDSQGNTLAENISGTTHTLTVEIPSTPQLTQYAMIAYIPGVTQSNQTYTPQVLLGSYTAPWTASVTNESSKYYFQIIDANNDGYTWGFYGTGVMIGWAAGDNAPDDWIFTPGIQLEKGKLYTFSADFKGYNTTTRPDYYEIKVGNEAQPESMTELLLERKKATKEYVTETVEFVPAASGVYYFGVHSCSDVPSAGLYMRNVRVSGASSAATPAAPVLKVETDAAGTLTANITVKAPTTERSGETLTSITGMTLYRDGEQIHAETAVVPGQSFTYTDPFTEAGLHTYRAVAQNATGSGKDVTASCYVGVNVAANPSDVKAVETSTGNVTVSWNPVTTDVDGNPIRPEFVTYLLLELKGEEQITIADNLKDTSYSFTALGDNDPQTFKKYGVAAKTTAGYSKGVLAPEIAVGKPLTLPYKESFANGKVSTPVTAKALVPAYAGSWSLATDETFTDMTCQDNDNGFAYFYGKYIDCPALLYTGKISLTGAEHPVLTFWLIDPHWSLNDKEDFRNTSEISVMIDLLDGNGYRTLYESSIADACDNEGWNKITVDLNEFKGKTVSIGFKGNTKKWAYTNIDNITIGDVTDRDIALKYISAPKFAVSDESFKITVGVENYGSKSADNAIVRLYMNGEVVDTKEVPALGTGKKAAIEFDYTLKNFNERLNTFHAEVVYPGDQIEGNNLSEEVTVEINREDLPAATNLAGIVHQDKKGVDLTWDAPTMEEGAMPPHTETFENANSWENKVDGWKFIDLDKGGAGGMNTGVVMPGVPEGSEQSWFVIDDRLSWLDHNRESAMNFAAYSGNKYIAAIFSMDFSTGPYPTVSIQNDDWAISPLLSGKAQTVKFKARSYSPTFLENFEVLYSLDGTDTDDFYTLKEVADVPATSWTEYSFDLPAGAKYFAIRYTANYKFMLFVDDVTYIPFNPNPLKLMGYDLYRDGVKVNADPITDTKYTDRFEKSNGNYALCSVYNHGVSHPAIFKAEGVETSVDEIGVNPSVFTSRGHIFILDAEGRDTYVTTANGITVYSGNPSENTDIAVASGIYIVRIGDKVFRIFVK